MEPDCADGGGGSFPAAGVLQPTTITLPIIDLLPLQRYYNKTTTTAAETRKRRKTRSNNTNHDCDFINHLDNQSSSPSSSWGGLTDEVVSCLVQLEHALTNVGAFMIPFDLSCATAVYSQSGFFSLPEKERLQYTQDKAEQRGFKGSNYTPFGHEPAYVKGVVQHVHSYSCRQPLGGCSLPLLSADQRKEHQCLFPKQPPSFGKCMTEFFNSTRNNIMLPLLTAFELILGLKKGFLAERCTANTSPNMSLLRFLEYPPLPTTTTVNQHTNTNSITNDKREEGQQQQQQQEHGDGDDDDEPTAADGPNHCSNDDGGGDAVRRGGGQQGEHTGISAHTDYELFTLLHQDAVGLQVALLPSSSPSTSTASSKHEQEKVSSSSFYQKDQQWVTVPTDNKNLATIIIGDTLSFWSNGWLKATPHRVHNPSHTQTRHSLVLFMAHDANVLIRPLTPADIACAAAGLNKHHKKKKEKEQQGENAPKQNKRKHSSNNHDDDDATATKVARISQRFRDWLSQPQNCKPRFPAVTQSDWIEQQEGEATNNNPELLKALQQEEEQQQEIASPNPRGLH
eukprot:TRINITY_DN67324_c2_g1_i1.p1 TRINITY_DN67324_c2_g1~~TRINITY_DN67324_c2_g1_i1.p1  ORF type:complete len:567 (+),score=113.02 TRINITY_DN67324_c2_g1_i1:65-1765(+)